MQTDMQFIMRTDHMMRLSCLPEQLVGSSEQLVLMDTKKGFIRPWRAVVIIVFLLIVVFIYSAL